MTEAMDRWSRFPFSRYKWQLMLAAIALLLGLGAIFYLHQRAPQTISQTVAAPVRATPIDKSRLSRLTEVPVYRPSTDLAAPSASAGSEPIISSRSDTEKRVLVATTQDKAAWPPAQEQTPASVTTMPSMADTPASVRHVPVSLALF